jgi:HSP20 family protein
MMKLLPLRNTKRWLDPFASLEDVRSEMNRLFDESILKFPKGTNGDTPWAPAVDIIDQKDNILVKADLPGLTKDQIEVNVQDDVLTIKGEKKEEKEVKEKDYVRTERSYGSFYRSFVLPTTVDAKNVKASCKDGVLEIKLPKKVGAQAKQIKVEIT